MTDEINENWDEDYRKLTKYSFWIHKRNLILQETDKYLLPDYPITEDQLLIVKDYRQKLRDFTNNDYVLPTKPDFINIMNA